MTSCLVCGGEAPLDLGIEKWVCQKCGRVFVVIARSEVKASGGEEWTE